MGSSWKHGGGCNTFPPKCGRLPKTVAVTGSSCLANWARKGLKWLWAEVSAPPGATVSVEDVFSLPLPARSFDDASRKGFFKPPDAPLLLSLLLVLLALRTASIVSCLRRPCRQLRQKHGSTDNEVRARM